MNKYLTLAAALCVATPALAQNGDYGTPGYTGGGPLGPSVLIPPNTTQILTTPMYTGPVPLYTAPPPTYYTPGDPEVARQIEELRQRNQLLGEQARERLLRQLAR